MSRPATPHTPRSTPIRNPTARTRLLLQNEPVHDGPCNHGTFSPRPQSPPGSSPAFGPPSFRGIRGIEREGSIRSDSGRSWPLGKSATTNYLAEQHGVRNPRLTYWMYYIPCLSWIRQYKSRYLLGDTVAGITMASFYIPIALSLSTNLAHLAPTHGLYAFAIQPLIYAILGSCPTMAVGPEAAGSLLLGSAIRLSNAHHGEVSDEANGQLASVITATAGAIALCAGIVRLGFLDSVLSRPLLRGFISAVGWVIFVDQLIPEMGLQELAKHDHVTHASSLTKIVWLFKKFGKAHQLTFTLSFVCFSIIMVGRYLKQKLGMRAPYIVFLPDRFLVVVLSAVLTYALAWDEQGVSILGKIDTGKFKFHFPFRASHFTHFQENFSTSFLIAVLGFFESVVAAKSLGSKLDNANISANRELVALGTANILGGCFQALPAFGGYGRSKVNIATGGQTPVSSVVLSLCTILCIVVLLPYFYYLPRCVLSSMVSVVACSLLEEAPADIRFFLSIKGYSEVLMMALIFFTTVVWSLELGMAVGVGISIVQVIRHSTRARIMILGRVPGTDIFKSAEDFPEEIEHIEGCLIVKIPEPLTFANTGELKNRLRRLELYGTTQAHPSLPRMRSVENNRNVVFDIHGVTSMDGSGTQVLKEIVSSYVARGVHVFFSRVPPPHSPLFELFENSGIVSIVGGRGHFVDSVEEALRMTEIEGNGGGDESGNGGGGTGRSGRDGRNSGHGSRREDADVDEAVMV
ncbi:sulfate transporter family-domain-containing protein [Kalaharituber pfeilii]|nr:sulfate transporter family-domain-containing protein [Kalaharituber pfeilii]